jgi:hypothetical protein
MREFRVVEIALEGGPPQNHRHKFSYGFHTEILWLPGKSLI